MKARTLLAVALVWASGSMACASGTTSTVSLRMGGEGPNDASVTIDERYLGSLAMVRRRGVALPPGRHRIVVEKSGFFPYDRLIDVKEGDPPVALDVAMQPIPD